MNPNASSPANPPGARSQDTHAAVGKQVTISSAAPVPLFGQADAIQGMIDLASQAPGRKDLVVKGVVNSSPRGWCYDRVLRQFISDIDTEITAPIALRAMASPTNPLTYTVVPRGSGIRIGIDRDEDGFSDRTEILSGSDPANAQIVPPTLRCSVTVNQANLSPGELHQVSIAITPGASLQPVDVYIALELPGGQTFYLLPGGILTPLPAPFVPGFTPVAIAGTIFSVPLSAGIPSGTYTWHTRLFVSGTVTLGAAPSSSAFAFKID